MPYIQIATKLIIAVIALWTMTKIMGKKEISQLTAFDFISSLMLSELVGNTVYQQDAHIPQLLFALVIWTLLSIGIEKLAAAIPWLSKQASGNPELLIKQGMLDEKAMKRNNLNIDQLQTLLREQGVFSIAEVAYGIFESNGNLSVIRRPETENGQLSDEPVPMPAVIISKGKIDRQALRGIGKDESWMVEELRKKGVDRPEDVLYAEWSDKHGMHVQMRRDPHVSFSSPVG
ncbi:DUF421 domain-containing protein [Cohnella pontilimi]|uniref:DUF421 domain-containing protein n=1 Tax=Cohnella pontilimi TaxID=2564100 RepID=A0A4U0FG87_9BACL|nr:DUF421 domain-containing protein [Cohnella pontilimi]TJY43911.1 DUF421 domain-containing protein [Cohnella pontilimi]